jgi:general L-amino acid transport system permease protein
VVVVLAPFFTIMFGGVFGLSWVETDRWGGLPLTILLASLSIVAGLSHSAGWWHWGGDPTCLPSAAFCTIYVELIRGVPLISVLFMASFMFPLFMPQGFSIDVLIRVLVGITLFAAAYMAEVIRGRPAGHPQRPGRSGRHPGLVYWQTQRKIVLPAGPGHGDPGHHEQLHWHSSWTPPWSPSSACMS